MFRRVLKRVLLAFGIVLIAIQFVPYGWWHDNPPVVDGAPWPDPAAEAVARSSCYACHSNETDWPLYSYVAPMSWLVRSDVESGRDEFNFSNWDRSDGDADEAVEMIEDGSMPPDRYTLIHRDASLSAEERDVLVSALLAMGGEDNSGRGGDDNSGSGGDEDNRGPGSGDD
jgi:Haem-binding domain